MNNGREKEDKEEVNHHDRKDEDEDQTNDFSEETVEKKGKKNFTVWFVRRSNQALTNVQCVIQFVHAVCGSYSEDIEGFGLKVTCNFCVRKDRINIEREGTKSGQKQQPQKMVSLSNSRLPAVDIGTNVVVRVPDPDRGRLAPPEMS